MNNTGNHVTQIGGSHQNNRRSSVFEKVYVRILHIEHLQTMYRLLLITTQFLSTHRYEIETIYLPTEFSKYVSDCVIN